MITVLCVAFLVIGIGLFVWNHLDKYEDTYHEDCTEALRFWVRDTFAIMSCVACLAMFITLMCLIPKIATEQKYQERIEAVQESNTYIEEQICASVESYLKHEENVYEKLDVTTAIGLFSAYPNLKSNELVQSLIGTYQTNASEIKAWNEAADAESQFKCPLGRDETDDCADCAYSADYHFVNGECVRRQT